MNDMTIPDDLLAWAQPQANAQSINEPAKVEKQQRTQQPEAALMDGADAGRKVKVEGAAKASNTIPGKR